MSNCLWCSKSLPAGTRADTKYCCGAHRTAAYHARKMALKRTRALSLDMFQQQDLLTVRKVSVIAADCVERVCAVAGKELASEVLDAVWDIAAQCGCDFTELQRLGR